MSVWVSGCIEAGTEQIFLDSSVWVCILSYLLALASVSDFLFIMSYALRSQVWNGPCVAGANDAFVDMMAGVEGTILPLVCFKR